MFSTIWPKLAMLVVVLGTILGPYIALDTHQVVSLYRDLTDCLHVSPRT